MHTHEQIQELISELKDQTKSNEDVQRLLDSMTRRVYQLSQASGNPFVRPVTKVAREDGYYAYGGNIYAFVETIYKTGIPMRHFPQETRQGEQLVMQNYYIVVSWHTARVIRAFNTNPDLNRFLEPPLHQICGPNITLPTTWEVRHKQRFESPKPLFQELGIEIGNRKFRMSDIFTSDCPVPVLKDSQGHGYYYPSDQSQILREFLLQTSGRSE